VKVKLNPVRSVVAGKRVVLVDDSIVRGTTSKKIVKMLRAAGASEIHMRISSPPTKNPCHYGIDTPRRKELIASTHDLEETRKFIEADSLGYLSLDGMFHGLRAVRERLLRGLFLGPVSDSADDARPAGHPLPRRRPARGRLGREACRGLSAARPHREDLTAVPEAARAAGDALSSRPRAAAGACASALRVSAGASRRRILGVHGGALKLSVKAPPEKGKANRGRPRARGRDVRPRGGGRGNRLRNTSPERSCGCLSLSRKCATVGGRDGSLVTLLGSAP